MVRLDNVLFSAYNGPKRTKIPQVQRYWSVRITTKTVQQSGKTCVSEIKFDPPALFQKKYKMRLPLAKLQHAPVKYLPELNNFEVASTAVRLLHRTENFYVTRSTKCHLGIGRTL
jgi:hypothetical protein